MSASSSGLYASLRRLLASSLELAQVRLQLFGTELEREKLRLLDALTWALAGLLLCAISAGLLIALVVLLVPDSYRAHGVAALTLLFAACGLGAFYAARGRLRAEGGPFAATRAELARDRAQLGARE